MLLRQPLMLAAPLIALGLAGAAAAQDRFADLTTIDRAVEGFTGAPIGTPGGATGPVDRRLRLAQCRSPLALAWHGRRQDAVRVECPDAGSWRIFVPLALGLQSASAAAAASSQSQQVLVERGQPVTIALTGRGFTVQQSGKALEQGVAGQWISVEPLGAKTPVQARVARPGLVTIPVG
jgi:flagellar basal body P-ring formation protein FlgA